MYLYLCSVRGRCFSLTSRYFAFMAADKFCRGTILAALVGDCYGYVYEDKPTVLPEKPIGLLQDTITGVATEKLIYTDDTQLSLAALRSLRKCGKFVPEDMAREFAHDYFTDGAHRCYGGNIGQIFKSLEAYHFRHPFRFAAEQFNGTGSFGNGGAMRAAPLAIYGLKMREDDFERLIVDNTRLTHTHPLAVYGALLIAFAVRDLWQVVSIRARKIDPIQFLDGLLNRLCAVQYDFVESKNPVWKSAFDQYVARFAIIKEFLTRSKDPTVSEIVKRLGNDLKAINSVPTALYAFLRSLKPIAGIPLESIPLRCLVFTISLGGDTDTIGTIACALAGGYTGLSEADTNSNTSAIPQRVLARCERIDILKDFAQWLCERCSL